MKSYVRNALVLVLCGSPLWCATLERLSLDDMIAKSTGIVRGKVTNSWAAASGVVIYTHYTIQVAERLKGSGGDIEEIVVPGGEVNQLRQSFSGAPVLQTGTEYVLFLYASKDGFTYVVGLTQGLFRISADGTVDPLATRTASRELMLDPASGKPVKDQTLVMHVSDLRSQVSSRLAAKGVGK